MRDKALQTYVIHRMPTLFNSSPTLPLPSLPYLTLTENLGVTTPI